MGRAIYRGGSSWEIWSDEGEAEQQSRLIALCGMFCERHPQLHWFVQSARASFLVVSAENVLLPSLSAFQPAGVAGRTLW